MEIRFRATPVSAGVAIGLVRKWSAEGPAVSVRRITQGEIESEKQRYRDAVAVCSANLERLADAVGGDGADILRAHVSIMQDPLLEQLTMERIDGHDNSERALMEAVDEVVRRFMASDDAIVHERVADVLDGAVRLLSCLRGEVAQLPVNGDKPAIVVARELPPSFAAQLDAAHTLGIVTETGGAASHTAIMARNLDLPAVTSACGVFAAARDGMQVVVDSETGEVVLDPSEETLRVAQEKRARLAAGHRRMEELRTLPAETTDGQRVTLRANIGFERECAPALAKGAEGIGLLRTEFYYMERRDFPNEESQVAAYRQVVRNMAPWPVVIRTLDVGGDKPLGYSPMHHEDNPALGLRGIRFSLRHEAVFKTQLRAILRASAHGPVRLMYPMVTSAEEVRQANGLLDDCKAELRREGKPFDESIRAGIMVETPAAVMSAGRLARHVAFFSIGTNDLTQYLLAADRDNERVKHIYSATHPVVLRAIREVVRAADRLPVAVCGELAGDPQGAVLLLGLGLRELSMAPGAVPYVKQALRGVSRAEAERLADEVMALDSADEVSARLAAFFAGRG